MPLAFANGYKNIVPMALQIGHLFFLFSLVFLVTYFLLNSLTKIN